MTDAPASAVSIRRQFAVAATVAAGAIHLAASVPHYADSAALGVGFTVMGLVQLAVAVAVVVLRGRRRIRAAATLVAVNLVAAAVWSVSRTVGLPIGHAGPEAVAAADVVTVVLELVAVLAIVWWAWRPAPARRWTRRAAVAVASGWVFSLAGAGVGVATVATDGHHGPAAHAAGEVHGDATTPGHHDGTSSDHDDPPAGSPTSDRTIPGSEVAAHLHADGSVHVHAPGTVHRHDDGTVHVHADAGGDTRTDTEADQRDPEPAPQPTAASPQDDGHTHAPGEGH